MVEGNGKYEVSKDESGGAWTAKLIRKVKQREEKKERNYNTLHLPISTWNSSLLLCIWWCFLGRPNSIYNSDWASDHINHHSQTGWGMPSLRLHQLIAMVRHNRVQWVVHCPCCQNIHHWSWYQVHCKCFQCRPDEWGESIWRVGRGILSEMRGMFLSIQRVGTRLTRMTSPGSYLAPLSVRLVPAERSDKEEGVRSGNELDGLRMDHGWDDWLLCNSCESAMCTNGDGNWPYR